MPLEAVFRFEMIKAMAGLVRNSPGVAIRTSLTAETCPHPQTALCSLSGFKEEPEVQA